MSKALKEAEKHLEELEQQIGQAKTELQALSESLTLLKQQPTAGEFTKAVRSFVRLYENEVPKRAEITFLGEALDIIDTSKARLKDLLEACEAVLKTVADEETMIFS